ncbi:MAG: hypothetical protein V7K42_19855 [Nostoc sp.]
MGLKFKCDGCANAKGERAHEERDRNQSQHSKPGQVKNITHCQCDENQISPCSFLNLDRRLQ